MKKILALVLAITAVIALAIPAMANNNPEVFVFEKNNANFHCNDIEGENGRVWPFGQGVKTSGSLKVQRIDKTTTWKLTRTDVPCPSCGRTDWVTFSNNSGVPNGNNVQLQHPFSRYRNIIVTVVYHLDVPKCDDFKCKYTNLKCDIICKNPPACPPCKYKDVLHVCEWSCNANHTCPLVDLKICDKPCPHAVINKTYIAFSKKILIVIEKGHDFTTKDFDVPASWKVDGNVGIFSSWKRSNSTNTYCKLPISGNLKNNTTFDVYYKGEGNCGCKCPDPETCKAQPCSSCDWAPPPKHEHSAVCDNCKNGVGKNHKNCETNNPEANTNYFCVKCPENKKEDLKLGQLQKGSWKNVLTGWKPAGREVQSGDVIKILYCQCPECFKEFTK